MERRFDPNRIHPRKLGEAIVRLCRDKSKEDMFEVVCVGTDRSPGDSLGPVVGSLLEIGAPSKLLLWGTTDNPIHAQNIEEFVEKHDPKQLVVAVDAALGKRKHVGTVHIQSAPLRPGVGVGKELPIIGDISIAGIVNIQGFKEDINNVILRNTNLEFVWSMARWIANGIVIAAETLIAGGGASDRQRAAATRDE